VALQASDKRVVGLNLVLKTKEPTACKDMADLLNFYVSTYSVTESYE